MADSRPKAYAIPAANWPAARQLLRDYQSGRLTEQPPAQIGRPRNPRDVYALTLHDATPGETVPAEILTVYNPETTGTYGHLHEVRIERQVANSTPAGTFRIRDIVTQLETEDIPVDASADEFADACAPWRDAGLVPLQLVTGGRVHDQPTPYAVNGRAKFPARWYFVGTTAEPTDNDLVVNGRVRVTELTEGSLYPSHRYIEAHFSHTTPSLLPAGSIVSLANIGGRWLITDFETTPNPPAESDPYTGVATYRSGIVVPSGVSSDAPLLGSDNTPSHFEIARYQIDAPEYSALDPARLVHTSGNTFESDYFGGSGNQIYSRLELFNTSAGLPVARLTILHDGGAFTAVYWCQLFDGLSENRFSRVAHQSTVSDTAGFGIWALPQAVSVYPVNTACDTLGHECNAYLRTEYLGRTLVAGPSAPYPNNQCQFPHHSGGAGDYEMLVRMSATSVYVEIQHSQPDTVAVYQLDITPEDFNCQGTEIPFSGPPELDDISPDSIFLRELQ